MNNVLMTKNLEQIAVAIINEYMSYLRLETDPITLLNVREEHKMNGLFAGLQI